MQKMSSVILIAPTGKLLRFQLLPLQKGTREAQRMKSAIHCGHTILTISHASSMILFHLFSTAGQESRFIPDKSVGVEFGAF